MMNILKVKIKKVVMGFYGVLLHKKMMKRRNRLFIEEIRKQT